jgi:uncharacterized membrane protein (DUF106 family)
MAKEKQDFKYTGVVGARKQLSSLGAFFFIVFGVPFTILSLGDKSIFPAWLFWFFVGGMVLGGVLLLGGAFAADIQED